MPEKNTQVCSCLPKSARFPTPINIDISFSELIQKGNVNKTKRVETKTWEKVWKFCISNFFIVKTKLWVKRKCAYPYPNISLKFSCECHLHFLMWIQIGIKLLKWLPEWLPKFFTLSWLCESKNFLSHHLGHGPAVSEWEKALCMWLQLPSPWKIANWLPSPKKASWLL